MHIRRRPSAALHALTLRWPWLVSLTVFGVCLAWTTCIVASERRSLDRITRGPVDTPVWVSLDDGAADEVLPPCWGHDELAWRTGIASPDEGFTTTAVATFGTLTFARSRPLAGRADTVRETVSLPDGARLVCDGRIGDRAGAFAPPTPRALELRRSIDGRVLQFRCAPSGDDPVQEAAPASEVARRLSVQLRAWVPTHPLRPARLALIQGLDHATRVGWCVFGGASALLVVLVTRASRRRSIAVERFGALPYRLVEVRGDAFLERPIGPRERGLLLVMLIACAASAAFTARCQMALDAQWVFALPSLPAVGARPDFPSRCHRCEFPSCTDYRRYCYCPGPCDFVEID